MSGTPYRYPEIEPYRCGLLDVGDGHQIWFEESGIASGKPVLYLHGGPGMGLEPHVRRLFDPQHYRLVQFDQRGCGRSTPFGSLDSNTTWHLVADIEKLRAHLGIVQWTVMGQSWGTALALAYAQQHPTAVDGLVLQGVFLGTEAEMDWVRNGWRVVFPESWEVLRQALDLEDPDQLHTVVESRLRSTDPEQQRTALMALTRFELACCYLQPPAASATELDFDFCRANTLINLHYVKNRFWLSEDQLIRELPRIRHLPCTLINGRFDIVAPMANAHRLAMNWPEAQLRVVPLAGHMTDEPGNIEAVTAVFDQLMTSRHARPAANIVQENR